MYYIALASDYDGTLADDGRVADATLEALWRLKETGRKLILVTGRLLPDLKEVFPQFAMFDKIVAENGALLYTPASEEERLLASPPVADFIERLRELGVAPLSAGRCIVSTWEPNEGKVLQAVRELGLELEIIFNKGAVMTLPSGVNKATGLAVALAELGLSSHNVVAVGDAENDHALLASCGVGVAVANALPKLKEIADVVLDEPRGAGVTRLADRIIAEDANLFIGDKQRVSLGLDESGATGYLRPFGQSVLIAGTSGVGKSTLATTLTERFAEQDFQFCILDPEGDYAELKDVMVVGDVRTPPSIAQAVSLLGEGRKNVVVNTLALKLDERPSFFAKLLPEIASLRARAARPHWLIFDEAHHLLPSGRDGASLALPRHLPAAIFIAVQPRSLAADVLAAIDTIIAVGEQAASVIAEFCAAIGEAAPPLSPSPGKDQVLFWRRGTKALPLRVAINRPRQEHKRHTRKYAEGRLGEDRSFYFVGPEGALKLRAYNLIVFLDLLDGVDERTFEHHLRAGDFSTWFEKVVGDKDLAAEAQAAERDKTLPLDEARAKIRDAVKRRYTAPASSD